MKKIGRIPNLGKKLWTCLKVILLGSLGIKIYRFSIHFFFFFFLIDWSSKLKQKTKTKHSAQLVCTLKALQPLGVLLKLDLGLLQAWMKDGLEKVDFPSQFFPFLLNLNLKLKLN